MKPNVVRGRFAPSPTGRMHLGNVYSALLSWLSAKAEGGEWVLRIEDLDMQRSRTSFADQIEDDLRWLGLSWDEGGSRGGANKPYFQSRRTAIYEHYFNRLCEQGIVYPCFCRRADVLAAQAPHTSDHRVVYAGTCRHLSAAQQKALLAERKPAIRLMVPDENIIFEDGHYGRQITNLAQSCGDFILRRADGGFAYQLAVVVDDALMGITQVVRGNDLLLSTAQQIYLYRLLGFEPPRFYHLPLLCSTSGERLCKRDKSLDMSELRRRYSAQEVLGRLAFYAGQIDRIEPVSLHQLQSVFCWDKVPMTDVQVNG